MRRSLVFVLLAGCHQNGDGERDLVDKATAVQRHMHERFAATTVILSAITSGDVPAARRAARTIAEIGEPDLLPEWRPYMANVRAAADLVAAQDLPAAARGLAVLGERCAECHETAQAKVTFHAPPAPSSDGRLAGEMASHGWSVARMWEGLVGPSPASWLEGAKTLEHANLTIVAEGGPFASGISNDIASVRLHASRAQHATTREQRAEVFGDLLQTCAGCHATIRDR